MYYSIGKLNPNHQSNIRCIGVTSRSPNENLVITGSKDHYLKVFSHLDGTSGLINLQPLHTFSPHCDGKFDFCF